jgi:hypothetical protein
LARAQLKHSVRDRAGNVVQNAKCYVYETGTTTAATDLFAAKTGGSAISGATLTSNAQGEIEGWLTTARQVDVYVTDNTDAAYYPSDPNTTLTFTAFTETVQAYAAPENTVTATAANVSVVATENIAAAEVQAALEEIANPTHIGDAINVDINFAVSSGHWAIAFDTNSDRLAVDLQPDEVLTISRGADEIEITIVVVPTSAATYFEVSAPTAVHPDDEGYVGISPWYITRPPTILDHLLDSDNVTTYMAAPPYSDPGYDGGARQGASGSIADADHAHDANFGGIFPGGTGSVSHSPGRWWQNYPQTIYAAPYEDLGVVTSDGVLYCVNVALPTESVVGEVKITSGATAMSGCTHLWLSVHNYHGTPLNGLLGQTVDAPGATWAANTTKTFTLPTPVTVSTGMDMPRIFIGLMITATQHPSLMGARIPTAMRPFAGGRVVRHDTGGLTDTAPTTLSQSFVGTGWFHVELETGY